MKAIEAGKNGLYNLRSWKKGRVPVVDIHPTTMYSRAKDGVLIEEDGIAIDTSIPPREPWQTTTLEKAKMQVLKSRLKIAIAAMPTALVEFYTTRDVYRGVVEHTDVLTQGYGPFKSAAMIVSGLALRSLYNRNKLRRAEAKEIKRNIKDIDEDSGYKEGARAVRQRNPNVDRLAAFRK